MERYQIRSSMKASLFLSIEVKRENDVRDNNKKGGHGIWKSNVAISQLI